MLIEWVEFQMMIREVVANIQIYSYWHKLLKTNETSVDNTRQ